MPPHAVVTIVRHGETAHNALKIVQGHLDVPLNSQGEAQAKVAGKFLGGPAGVTFDEAWSSDLSRARRTAELILAEQPNGGVPLQEDERIRERFLGDLQGKKRGDPGVDMSTIEPAPALLARLFSFWDARFPSPPPPSSDPTAPPRQLILVSHGAAIKAFINGLLAGRAQDYAVAPEGFMGNVGESVANCSFTRIEMAWDEGAGRWKGRLLSYSDEGHFAESSRAPSPGGANADVVDA